jgi:hypothetical protein
MTLMQVVMWALSAIGGAFIGGFLHSYMSKKGENLATKEDLKLFVEKVRQEEGAKKEAEITAIQSKLDIVVEQNRAIVRSGEEIKDQISNRQRLWQLKLEAAYDVVKLHGVMTHIFTRFHGPTDPDFESARKRYHDVLEDMWKLGSVIYLLLTKVFTTRFLLGNQQP